MSFHMKTPIAIYEQQLQRELEVAVAGFTRAQLQENRNELDGDLEQNPRMLAERAGWFINGSVGGEAAHILSRKWIEEKSVYEAAKKIIIHTLALEWRVRTYQAEKAWQTAPGSTRGAMLRRVGLNIGEIKKENKKLVQRAMKIEEETHAILNRHWQRVYDHLEKAGLQDPTPEDIRRLNAGSFKKLKLSADRRAAEMLLVASDAWLEAGYPKNARRAAIRAAKLNPESIQEPRRIGVRRDVSRGTRTVRKKRRYRPRL